MKEIVIGILFVGALAVLMYFAFSLGGTGSLGEAFGPKMREIKIVFPEVTGLKARNDVLVSGLSSGSVSRFEKQEDGRILVICRIDETTTIFNDVRAEIVDASAVFGAKMINIFPGKVATGPFPRDRIIEGVYVPNVLVAMSRLVDRITVAVEDVVTIAGDIKVITADLKDGRGPAGVILRDEEAAANIREIIFKVKEASQNVSVVSNELKVLMNEVNNGKGAAHRIFYDEQLSRDLSESMSSIRRGTDEFATVMSQARSIASSIENGDGLISALLKDAELKGDFKSTIAAADDAMVSAAKAFDEGAVLLKNINEGKGTLGKLATNDALYNDLLRAVNTLQQGFEDIREQAPVTAFASVVFQVFQ